jgi:hypothetical protein
MNKKQKREQERLAAEAQARAAEQTAAETVTEDIVSTGIENQFGATDEVVSETTETEGEVTKTDPNAASKAKALENRKIKAEKARVELLQKYPHVTAIVAEGANGPTRVRIRCTDPQTKQVDGKAVPVCEGEREIAVQDLFQVTRCVSCQDRVIRKARRVRQTTKNKQLRKIARDMKGGL